MSLTVTMHLPSNVEQGLPPTEVHEICNVYAPDAEFFKKYGIKVSMEPLDVGEFAVYADTGKVTDGEPDELMVISGDRSCHDTLKALRQACEKRFDEEGYPNEHR